MPSRDKPSRGRGNGRGRGRGRGRGGRGASQGNRAPKREFERHSGTGRGREVRKGSSNLPFLHAITTLLLLLYFVSVFCPHTRPNSK